MNSCTSSAGTSVPITTIINTTGSRSATASTAVSISVTASKSVTSSVTASTSVPTSVRISTPVPKSAKEKTSLPTSVTASTSVPTSVTASTSVPKSVTASTSVPTSVTASTSVPTSVTTSTSVPKSATANVSLPTSVAASSSVPKSATANTSLPISITANTSVPTSVTTSTSVPTSIKGSTNTSVTTSTSVSTSGTSSISIHTSATTSTVVLKSVTTSTAAVPAAITTSTSPSSITASKPVPTFVANSTTVSTSTTASTAVRASVGISTSVPPFTTAITSVLTSVAASTGVPTSTITRTSVPVSVTASTPIPTSVTTNILIPTSVTSNAPVHTSAPSSNVVSQTRYVDITQEETNYLRLITLVLKIAPRAIRQLFDTYNNPRNLKNKLNEQENKDKLRELQRKRVINQDQWNVLYPAHGNVKSEHFDMTLMTLLLREISGLSEPNTGWNKLPHGNDQTGGADIVRIKFYRNKFAHSTTCSVINYEFNNIWSDLSQAVIRVGGLGFTAEVNALLTCALDSSYKDLHRELRRLIEVHELPSRVQTLELSCKALYQHLKKLRERSELPSSLQNYKREQVTQWEKDDGSFYETKATKYVKEIVDESKFIQVIGAPGAGKSAIIHHVALKLSKEAYSVYPIKTIANIVEYWIPDIDQVFILDDPFGVHCVDETEIKQWEKYKDVLKICFKYSNMKIMAAVRSQIALDEKMSGIFSDAEVNMVNISDGNLDLSSDERVNIFHKHALVNQRKDLCSISSAVENFSISCFPLLCRIYTADTGSNQTLENFFKRPLSICEEINELRKKDPLRYFCLLLCMLYDNKLPASVIQLVNESKQTKKKRRELLELCKLPTSTSREEIRSKMDTLLQTFVKLDGCTYHFVHDLVHDAVIQSVSNLPSSLHQVILRHCSFTFMRYRVHLSGVICKDVDDCTHETEFCINIRRDAFCFWADRVLELINDSSTRSDQTIGEGVCEIESFFPIRRDAIPAYTKLTEQAFQQINEGTSLSDQLKNDIEQANRNMFGERVWRYNPWRDVFRYIPCVRSTDGDTAIGEALSRKSPSDVQTMMCSIGYGVYVCNRRYTALHSSMKYGLTHTIMRTLSMISQAKLKELDSMEGFLCWALEGRCNTDVIRALIDAGLDVNTPGDHDRTPLYWSACNYDYKTTELLLNHRVSINQRDVHGESVLYCSVYNRDYKTTKLLLHHGANIDQSALHMAVYHGDYEITELLLNYGASINQRDVYGESVLYCSVYNRDYETTKLLLHHGVNIDQSALHMAAFHGDYEITELFLNHGASINQRDAHDESALYHSVYNRDYKTTKYLLHNGANIDQLALLMAVYRGDYEITELLLNYGANINQCNVSGNSVLYQSQFQEHDTITELLQSRGGLCIYRGTQYNTITDIPDNVVDMFDLQKIQKLKQGKKVTK